MECNTCSGEHDDAIHKATIRIHSWLRADLKRRLAMLPKFDPTTPRPKLTRPPGAALGAFPHRNR